MEENAAMNSEPETSLIQPCFRCGKPSDEACTGPRSGWLGSEPESQLPMCAECNNLLTTNPTEFWKPLQKKIGGS